MKSCTGGQSKERGLSKVNLEFLFQIKWLSWQQKVVRNPHRALRSERIAGWNTGLCPWFPCIHNGVAGKCRVKTPALERPP